MICITPGRETGKTFLCFGERVWVMKEGGARAGGRRAGVVVGGSGIFWGRVHFVVIDETPAATAVIYPSNAGAGAR